MSAIALTLPDGTVRHYNNPVSGLTVAADIGEGLARAAMAVTVNGEVRDLTRPIEQDADITIVTARDEADALELVRHDYAHVLAEAVQALFPDTQITFGPATDDGFYYDFAPKDRPFTEDDLPAIEDKMRAIIQADKPLRREVWDRHQLMSRWRQQGETFKAEWAQTLPEDEDITVYWSGEDWMDMCKGPHLASTGKLDPQAFKLTKVAGAYWRGDPRNPMLSRIYGTGWLNKKQLKAHLLRIEEAEKRDHRKLGREMALFHMQEEAQGSVFWHPKGYRIWTALERYIRRRQHQFGYEEIKTPQLLDAKLWEQSGHWGKFRENMFIVPDVVPNTEGDHFEVPGDARMMALKPMNCPAHVQIFNQGIRSYRDLPIRFSEFGCCHRNEAHGALHGLMRVRQMTQDDGHIFCREDQIAEETERFLALFNQVYADVGLTDIRYKLATRPEARAGDDATWDRAEKALADALTASGLEFDYAPGEGAFYGPKLEFHLTDAIGRTWQCGTFQLDYVIPERLGARYIGEDGAKHIPVMLHRAVFGTFERFIGLITEHFAGKFPLWLAPVQLVVATITSDADDYAREVFAAAESAGLRAELDLRNEKINYKVREHSHAKVPVMFVVGKKEAEDSTVSIRRLGSKYQTVTPLSEALAHLKTQSREPGEA